MNIEDTQINGDADLEAGWSRPRNKDLMDHIGVIIVQLGVDIRIPAAKLTFVSSIAWGITENVGSRGPVGVQFS